nr:hypothetical protein L203_01083 [Cryptococcus depauperatus CBS 7841]
MSTTRYLKAGLSFNSLASWVFGSDSLTASNTSNTSTDLNDIKARQGDDVLLSASLVRSGSTHTIESEEGLNSQNVGVRSNDNLANGYEKTTADASVSKDEGDLTDYLNSAFDRSDSAPRLHQSDHTINVDKASLKSGVGDSAQSLCKSSAGDYQANNPGQISSDDFKARLCNGLEGPQIHKSHQGHAALKKESLQNDRIDFHKTDKSGLLKDTSSIEKLCSTPLPQNDTSQTNDPKTESSGCFLSCLQTVQRLLCLESSSSLDSLDSFSPSRQPANPKIMERRGSVNYCPSSHQPYIAQAPMKAHLSSGIQFGDSCFTRPLDEAAWIASSTAISVKHQPSLTGSVSSTGLSPEAIPNTATNITGSDAHKFFAVQLSSPVLFGPEADGFGYEGHDLALPKLSSVIAECSTAKFREYGSTTGSSHDSLRCPGNTDYNSQLLADFLPVVSKQKSTEQSIEAHNNLEVSQVQPPRLFLTVPSVNSSTSTKDSRSTSSRTSASSFSYTSDTMTPATRLDIEFSEGEETIARAQALKNALALLEGNRPRESPMRYTVFFETYFNPKQTVPLGPSGPAIDCGLTPKNFNSETAKAMKVDTSQFSSFKSVSVLATTTSTDPSQLMPGSFVISNIDLMHHPKNISTNLETRNDEPIHAYASSLLLEISILLPSAKHDSAPSIKIYNSFKAGVNNMFEAYSDDSKNYADQSSSIGSSSQSPV